MATIRFPRDFREFLQLLNLRGVEYLVVGGYAVGFHGFPRATADLDIWIGISRRNAEKTAGVLREFGFDLPEVKAETFMREDNIARMGVPPVRIEVMTSITGVSFEHCFAERQAVEIEGVKVNFISLKHLKENKRLAGRHQDLADLERLP
jgi:predicted nucleotidyltransferase